QNTTGIGDVPEIGSITKMRGEEVPDPAGNFDPDRERGQEIAPANDLLLANGQRRGEDRRRGVDDGAVRVVVVFDVPDVSIGEGCVLERGPKAPRQNGRRLFRTVVSEEIQEDVDGGVLRAVQG